jgi:hypothetical protein
LDQLERSSKLTPTQTGEAFALKMCSNTEEAERCARLLAKAKRDQAADRSTGNIGRGLLGGGAAGL